MLMLDVKMHIRCFKIGDLRNQLSHMPEVM
jgi:hypothetical protein